MWSPSKDFSELIHQQVLNPPKRQRHNWVSIVKTNAKQSNIWDLFYGYPGAIKTLLETCPQLRRLTDSEIRDHLAIHQHLLIESTLVVNLLGTGHKVFLFIHPALELLPFLFSTQPPSSGDLFQLWNPSLDRGLLLLVIQHNNPVSFSYTQICSLPHRHTEPMSIQGAPTCWRSVEINIGTWVTRLSYLSEPPQIPAPDLVLMQANIISSFARIQLHST